MAAYLEPLSSLLSTSLATLPDPDSSLHLSPLPSRPSSTADLDALQGAVQSSLLPALPALPSWQPLLEALSQLRHSLYPLQHLPYPPSLGSPPPCSPDISTVTSTATAALATAASLCATAPQPDGPTSAALSPLLLEVLGAAALCASRRLAVDAYAALCSGSGSAGCWRALCSSRQLPLTHPASPARLHAVLDCHSVFQRQCASLCALLSPALPQPPLTPDAQCLLATAALVLPLREGTGALPPPPCTLPLPPPATWPTCAPSWLAGRWQPAAQRSWLPTPCAQTGPWQGDWRSAAQWAAHCRPWMCTGLPWMPTAGQWERRWQCGMA